MTARAEQLPAEKRGLLACFLLSNAVMTLTLQGTWFALLARGGWAASRQGVRRPGRALRAAWSPSLGVATALVVAQHLSRPLLLRSLDRWVSARIDPEDP